MMSKPETAGLGEEVVRHLQALLRIDTSNPPGGETPAAEYLATMLAEAGLDPTLLGPSPERRSLVVRLRASCPTADNGPLLLHAHLDVVPAEGTWSHEPFAGDIDDGYLWGRGAIDMKHMAAMAAVVLARLAREKRRLNRDIIFAAVADEETGCESGSRFLVENHAEMVRAEYGLGEVGGATVWIGDRPVYPVQVAEKGLAWLRLRARGEGGHGSIPRENSAVVRLAEAIARLGRTPLPQHVVPAAERYLDALAACQPFPRSLLLQQLRHAFIAPHLLDRIADRAAARTLSAILSNTASPTILRAGLKANVIPSEAEADVDGRTLPGQSTCDLIAEVRAVIGEGIEIEVLQEAPPVETSPDTPLFQAIARTVSEHHEGAIVVPALMPAFTDAKFYSRLGTRCYGFTPLRLPKEGPRFADLFHSPDERVPVDGLIWGANVLYSTILRFASCPP